MWVWEDGKLEWLRRNTRSDLISLTESHVDLGGKFSKDHVRPCHIVFYCALLPEVYGSTCNFWKGILDSKNRLGWVAYACNSTPQKTKAGGLPIKTKPAWADYTENCKPAWITEWSNAFSRERELMSELGLKSQSLGFVSRVLCTPPSLGGGLMRLLSQPRN